MKFAIFLISLIIFMPASGFADDKPNVLLITIDSLRPDHLSCGGYDKPTSPNIDKIAREGAFFPNAISQGNWTSTGLVSMLTSLYPATHGIIYGNQDQIFGMDPAKGGDKKFIFKSPGQILKENGYLVYAISYFYQNTGFEKSAKNIFDTIDECKDKKFFIWYHTPRLHAPYNPPSPYNTMFLPDKFLATKNTLSKLGVVKTHSMICSTAFHEKLDKAFGGSVAALDFTDEDKVMLRAFYDGELKWADDEVGDILKKIEDLKLSDNTIIILSTDHSEELLERNHLAHASDSLEGSLYDELIKIPIVIRYPKKIPQNVVLDNQVQQVDIMPTIFDIIGLDIPKEFQGKSLLRLLQGKTPSFYEDAFSMGPPCGHHGYHAVPNDKRMIYSVREARYKFIWNYSPEEDRYEIYDLEKDPMELRNIAKDDAALFARLKDKLNTHLDTYQTLKERLFQ